MDHVERSRQFVDDALAGLRVEYGGFPVIEGAWTLTDAVYETHVDRLTAGALGGAGAAVAADDGAVLFVRDAGEDAWSDPGGKREAGESFATAARRETREETGIEPTITDVAFAQSVAMDAPDRPALSSLIVVFHASGSGEPEPRDDEIDAARWFDHPPENLLYDALERIDVPGA